MDFSNNRALLGTRLQPGHLAVINANDIMPTNADGTMPFRQNNDLFWLTGIKQEETTLLLFPDCPDRHLREVLFIKHADETHFKWHGRRLSQQEAAAISGIGNIKWAEEFDTVLHALLAKAEGVYLNSIEHPRAENKVQTRDDRFAAAFRSRYPLVALKRLAPLMAELRCIKSDAELARMREACRITEAGFRRLLGFVRPGVKERQVAAELIHEYMQHDGDWAGYQPIVASGANSCILHYIENANVCETGEVLLIDAAASYGPYNADLTRVIPVSGRFSGRQKEVYKAVLRIHQALKRFVKAGVYLREAETLKNKLVLEELITLGLCSRSDLEQKGDAYYLNRYSYHGFGHFLGLDVHDVGDNYAALPVNSVITIEPGIYIREEKIGVRLENNVVIKNEGIDDLMATTPIEPEEIEELMNRANAV